MRENRPETVEKLLDAGVELNNYSSLYEAVGCGYIRIVSLFMAKCKRLRAELNSKRGLDSMLINMMTSAARTGQSESSNGPIRLAQIRGTGPPFSSSGCRACQEWEAPVAGKHALLRPKLSGLIDRAWSYGQRRKSFVPGFESDSAGNRKR